MRIRCLSRVLTFLFQTDCFVGIPFGWRVWLEDHLHDKIIAWYFEYFLFFIFFRRFVGPRIFVSAAATFIRVISGLTFLATFPSKIGILNTIFVPVPPRFTDDCWVKQAHVCWFVLGGNPFCIQQGDFPTIQFTKEAVQNKSPAMDGLAAFFGTVVKVVAVDFHDETGSLQLIFYDCRAFFLLALNLGDGALLVFVGSKRGSELFFDIVSVFSFNVVNEDFFSVDVGELFGVGNHFHRSIFIDHASVPGQDLVDDRQQF